jgi:hypothetical protein
MWNITLRVLLACAGMVLLHAAELFVTPPARYPDLYPALFSIFGAGNLLAAYLSCVAWQWSSSSDVDDMSPSQALQTAVAAAISKKQK